MASIKPIRTKGDYDAALARIDELMNALSGPEGQVEDTDDPDRVELDVLTDLVEFYEERHHPFSLPSAAAAIKYRMDQQTLTQRDLIPHIGSRSKVAEVLSGKRDITMSMARALNRHLGIPADVLLQKPGSDLDAAFNDMEPRRFPLKEMAKRGWIPDLPDLTDHAEELIGGLIRRAGGFAVAVAPLYRKNDNRRVNAKTNEYALKAWCWRVMASANERKSEVPYEPGVVTMDFLRRVAQFSPHEDGPLQARDFLREHGIGIEFVRHLPRTYLDGAALRLASGRPVIGLTLRYDRIDNFWFCLMHELAHVGLHLDGNEDESFIDDLTLRNVIGVTDPKETQADQWAEEAFIPLDVWETTDVRKQPTPFAVMSLANAAQIHPAIVAGRVRHERRNYRLLSQFVGTGKVRRQLNSTV